MSLPVPVRFVRAIFSATLHITYANEAPSQLVLQDWADLQCASRVVHLAESLDPET